MKTKVFKLNPLSLDSIKECQKQIKQYQVEFQAKMDLFTRRLAEIGVGIAQAKAIELDAYYSGTLVSSIDLKRGDVIQHGSNWIIFTDCPYAKYVEFGTGIIGGLYGSHPLADEKGWEYDVNNHGIDGWRYLGDDDKWHWTNGTQAKPFMYETAFELNFGAYISKVAKEVWGR